MVFGAFAQVTTTMANLEGDACPAWEEELYQIRVCQSFTCQSCKQEWCTNLCHKLKIEFGACNKQVVCKPRTRASRSGARTCATSSRSSSGRATSRLCASRLTS